MICLVHNTFHDLIHCKHILSSFSLLSENNKKRIHDRIYACNGFLRLLRNQGCNYLQNGVATFSIFALQLSVLLLCNIHLKNIPYILLFYLKTQDGYQYKKHTNKAPNCYCEETSLLRITAPVINLI